MATKETRAMRGRRRGRELISTVLKELEQKRVEAAVSQELVASTLGTSQSAVARVLTNQRTDIGVIELSEIASVLGMELSVRLYPVGDPVRDKGQLALGRRFDARLATAWRVTNETLLPGPGDRRSWDKLLRLTTSPTRHLVGVDLETRIRDIQALVRRTRERERDGQANAILLVLSDSATNRLLVDEFRHELGPDYETSPGRILAALSEGKSLPGSGVLLL
jgi:hypothetical protein